jgi:phage protein, HK97 gp10 family
VVEIKTNLSGDIIAGLDALEANIKGEVLLSGVAAMARVIYDEVKLNTSPPRMGRKTGNLHDAVYRVYAKERGSDDTKVYRVSVNHKKAPHWHLLEFGTSRAPAHPYIRPAFDKIQQAIEAGNERMRVVIFQGGTGGATRIPIVEIGGSG